jgi:hypothetical protein
MPTKAPTNAPIAPFWKLSSDTVQGLVLTIVYSWNVSNSLADLDGGVYWLGVARGFDCNPKSFYITLQTSTTGATGTEVYTVKLGEAYANKRWSGLTTLQLRAGWKQTDEGVATLALSTTRVLANGTTVNDNNPISFGIDPPLKEVGQCAPPLVDMTVVIDADGKVRITVPK